MGLRREDEVIGRIRHGEPGALPGAFGHDRADAVSQDGARVVPEGDHAVGRIRLERLLEYLHQRFRYPSAVDYQFSLEEPVARMLAVRLGEVEALHVGRVALEVFGEEVVVVLDVPGVQSQAKRRVDLLKRRNAFLDKRDGPVGLRSYPRFEGREGFGIEAFGHPVVDCGQESVPCPPAERGIGHRSELPRSLDPRYLVQAARAADRDRIRRPCRREVHSGSYFDHRFPGEETPGGETVRRKGFRQKPPERSELRFGQGSRSPDVEAVLRFDPFDVRGDIFPGEGEKTVPPGIGERGISIEMQQFHRKNRHFPGMTGFRITESVLLCFP